MESESEAWWHVEKFVVYLRYLSRIVNNADSGTGNNKPKLASAIQAKS
jgi:hypothetical protein